MVRRREKTKWSRLEWSPDRKGGRLQRSSPVGPRFEAQSRKAVEQEIISEFCCVEDLPDGFTKIRSKNLDIIFKREFYENKTMMTPPNSYYDGEIPPAEATALQSSFIFDQMDLDEIPEFRPRDGSFTTSIGNDSGYSTSFQEVFPEQLQFPPLPLQPPPHYLPYQTVDMSLPQPLPQFYLYTPGVNTLIPCEEIIISNTILSPEGPVYQNPTKAYVAYPVPGPENQGCVRQPLIVPDTSGSPPAPLPGEEDQEPEPEETSKVELPMSRKTPGIKHLPTDPPVVSKYIPGLPLQTLKTKKRRKKKSKAKLPAGQSKVSLSSSDSEAKETRVVDKGIQQTQPHDGEMFDFDLVEASDDIEIKLTDDLTNSLVNPPTEDDDVEDTKIAEDLMNLIETEAENVGEAHTNVPFSYSEAVLKEIPRIDEIVIPTETRVEDFPEKPSKVQTSKSEKENKKPKVTKTEVEEEPESFCPVEEEMEDKENQYSINSKPSHQIIEEISTEATGWKVSKYSKAEEGPAPATEEEAEETSRDIPHPPPVELSGRTRRSRRRRGRERRDSSPPQRVLVVDDQVSASPEEVGGGKVVSTVCDLLVIRELGHGMARGVMDLERPFLGHYTPPDRQDVDLSTYSESPCQKDQDQHPVTIE